MSITPTLRIGIIGAGNVAHFAQLPTLAGRPDVELTAVVSRREDPSELVHRWSFGAAHRTVEDMLSGSALDAVFVLTPRGEHAAAVEQALAAGVDVFCEKPLATATSDAERLADLADAHGRILMVGFNRRFAPVYAAGRDAFGEDGPAFCVAQKHRAGSEYRATFENSIHMVDLLRWYCGGEPVEVSASADATDQWLEDGVAALIRFSTGNTGVLMAARAAGGWLETLDAYGGMTSVQIKAPDRIAITQAAKTTVREMSSEAFGWATATSTFGFAAAVDHFIDRVRDRAQPLTSGREAVRTQSLLDRILAAAGLPTEEQPGHEWSSHALN